MGIRTIQFGDDEFYHIYNRGVDKRIIFNDNSDRQRFVNLLYLANSKQSIDYREIKSKNQSIFDYEIEDKIISIGAYCLMPNHFHILVRAKEGVNVNKFMNKLCTGYSMYFNKKNDRSGALFQGRFKAKYADSDEYLKYLFSYIHLNPLHIDKDPTTKDRPSDNLSVLDLYHAKEYQWSSLLDYYGVNRQELKILDIDEFPAYFSSSKALDKELLDWINFSVENNP